MKTICIYPEIKKDNAYIKNLVSTLDNYNIIEFKQLIKKPYLFFKIDIFHFNWIENINSKYKLTKRIEYIIKLFILMIIGISGKKIVWTLHNKEPHDGNKLCKNIMIKMSKYSQKILIHCKESLKTLENLGIKTTSEKIVYVPHGNYIGNYKKKGINIRSKFKLDRNDTIYMFIGQIRKYKNIELLIESFKEANIKNSKLLIVGSCNEDYQVELINKYPDVLFEFKFINDDEMVDYIDCADIFITPYNINTSLNSGSIIMYFSYGKSVISPNIGTLKDIDRDFYYGYIYNKEEEHKDTLINTIKKASYELEVDKECFTKKGQEALEYVNENLDWNRLKGDIVKIYY